MASEHLQAPRNTEGNGSMRMPEEPTPIELILEHAVTSTDQQLVCTMAMVCKDWRAATQTAAVARLHIKLEFYNIRDWAPGADGLPSNSMRKLFSFAEWLPKHAQIVSQLKVSNDRRFGYYSSWQLEPFHECLRTIAEPTLGLALRGAAAATASHGATQLQARGLQSYSSTRAFDTSAVLQALPAASLIELKVRTWDISAVTAALPRLTNLQRLKAQSLRVESDRRIMAATLKAACQLSALTSLGVGFLSSSDLTLLPEQLLRLTLLVRLQQQDKAVVDLSHLTRLTSLDISADLTVGGSTLPVQLVDLCTRGDWHSPSVCTLYNITSLRQLENLSIVTSVENAEELLQLGQLANLQNLALEYEDTEKAMGAFSAWPQLRQLKSVGLDFLGCTEAECMDLVQALGSVTQLTRLDISFQLIGYPAMQVPKVAICREIAKLTMLRDLSLDCFDLWSEQLSCVQSDIHHLSKLTNLTNLVLCPQHLPTGQDVFPDPTVVKILQQMKHLEELCVPINGVTVLPVIGSLTNLKRLELLGAPPGLKESGVQYLQGLSMLTRLEWYSMSSCNFFATAPLST